jgi:prophage maintenance system killer protein
MSINENQFGIEIFTYDNGVEIEVHTDEDTVWLNQAQLQELFGRDQSVISRHINNAVREGELDRKSNMQNMHIPNSDKPITLYDLDTIISVGYRIKSEQGVAFRRWATKVLRNHMINGYTVNKRRLESIGKAIEIISRSNDELVSGIADVLTNFATGLDLLDRYDHQSLKKPKGEHSTYVITYEEAIAFIDSMRFTSSSDLFGNEKDKSFHGSLGAIYQTYDGKEVYPSIEEKAANLLYFIVKNHSFSDGNKRIAAALFVYFLNKNEALVSSSGKQVIDNNTLAAVTLMIALSKPEEKEIMTTIVMNMLCDRV